jgi:hypothetical protein
LIGKNSRFSHLLSISRVAKQRSIEIQTHQPNRPRHQDSYGFFSALTFITMPRYGDPNPRYSAHSDLPGIILDLCFPELTSHARGARSTACEWCTQHSLLPPQAIRMQAYAILCCEFLDGCTTGIWEKVLIRDLVLGW